MRAEKKVEGRKDQRSLNGGFSLIELLLVVAVILIIAAIAIPNFIRSKMRANEAAAVENMRTISTAEVSYSTTYAIGYSTNLTQLSDVSPVVDQNNAALIDQVLAAGTKSGYIYTYAVTMTDPSGMVTNYSLNADPIGPTTGTNHFYTDQTAVVRSNSTQAAGPTDTPIG